MGASQTDCTALFVSGTVGVGKTSAANAIGAWLAERGVPHAVIDLDSLRRCWPSPPSDPFNSAIELVNLRGVAQTYRSHGARRLILAGVIEKPSARLDYEEAIGVPLTVCRLRADFHVVSGRLAQRHDGDEASLTWHLDRFAQLDKILELAALEDFTVDVGEAGIPDVAAAIIQGAGWDREPGP